MPSSVSQPSSLLLFELLEPEHESDEEDDELSEESLLHESPDESSLE